MAAVVILAPKGCGHIEVDATVIVFFFCGVQVDVGQRDTPWMSRSEIEECRSDDGIVFNIELMAIFKYQRCRWRGIRCGSGKAALVRGMSGRGVRFGRDIGTSTGTATIEDGRSALVVGLVVRLFLFRTIGIRVDVIRDRIGIPVGARIAAIVARAPMTVVNGMIRAGGTRRVPAWADRSYAWRGAVDGATADTRRSH